jgi:hypothetical protein
MPRARWFVIGFLLVVAVAGGVLNERGPFAAHPTLAYDQFLVDFEAGRIEQIVRWRDQLEVTDQGALRSVVVPAGRDLPADLAAARRAGGVGLEYAVVPDAWFGLITPYAAGVIAIAGLLLWASAVLRDRHFRQGRSPRGEAQPAA